MKCAYSAGILDAFIDEDITVSYTHLDVYKRQVLYFI